MRFIIFCILRWCILLFVQWYNIVNIKLFSQFSENLLFIVICIIGINIGIFLGKSDITHHFWSAGPFSGVSKILLEFDILVVFFIGVLAD